jgi:hypothetical protein
MTVTTAVVRWDNGMVMHKVAGKIKSPYPGSFDISLLYIAFFIKRLQLMYRSCLRTGESLWLWTRFIIRYQIPRLPRKTYTATISFIVIIKREELHRNIRRIAVTVVYSVGALTLLAAAPKVIMIVWSV